MEYGRTEGNFELRLVNDQVEKAYTQLREFILPTIAKLDGELRRGGAGRNLSEAKPLKEEGGGEGATVQISTFSFDVY